MQRVCLLLDLPIWGLRPSYGVPLQSISLRSGLRCSNPFSCLSAYVSTSNGFPLFAQRQLAALQALRQSLLKKYSTIRRDMSRLHNSRMSPYERQECLESIRSQVQAAWRTDEIRRHKPSPQVTLARSARLQAPCGPVDRHLGDEHEYC